MSDPLNGIRLKIKRAWSQLDTLKADITAFLNQDIYIPRVNFNPQLRRITVSVSIQKVPDPMWGVRIGEFIHDLRSALDHTIYEIVLFQTKRASTSTKLQFPIFETYEGFNRRGIPKQLPGVKADAVQLIRAEQPFPNSEGGTGEGTASPIWHLHELSNADKHRTLSTTGTLLHQFDFEFAPLTRTLENVQRTTRGLGPLQQYAILATIDSPDLTECPFENQAIKGRLGIDIAFDEGKPSVGGWLVYPTLVDIANRTETVISRIAKGIFNSEL